MKAPYYEQTNHSDVEHSGLWESFIFFFLISANVCSIDLWSFLFALGTEKGRDRCDCFYYNRNY